jgi:AraC-like DNA-binding protein
VEISKTSDKARFRKETHFNLYTSFITPKFDYQEYLLLEKDILSFIEPETFAGIYSVAYTQTDENLMGFHRHDFFECVLMLEGSCDYVIKKKGNPSEEIVRRIFKGEILFVQHEELHQLRPNSPEGFDLIVLCFLPSAIGLDDRLLKDTGPATYYRILEPFFLEHLVHERHSVKPSEEAYIKILHLAFHLSELFLAGQTKTLELRRQLLIPLLSLLRQEYVGLKQGTSNSHRHVEKMLSFLQKHYLEKITLSDLADASGLSPSHISSVFLRFFGQTPFDYVRSLRLEKAKEFLIKSDLPISAVVHESGFENLSHFSTLFKKQFKFSPKAYRAMHHLKK